MHLIGAVLLALHSAAHLRGFRAAFWPTPISIAKRSYFGSKFDGVVWLTLALGFAGSALLLLAHRETWTTLLLWSASGSALMCLFSWPDARARLVIDIVLVLLVLLLAPANGLRAT